MLKEKNYLKKIKINLKIIALKINIICKKEKMFNKIKKY